MAGLIEIWGLHASKQQARYMGPIY